MDKSLRPPEVILASRYTLVDVWMLGCVTVISEITSFFNPTFRYKGVPYVNRTATCPPEKMANDGTMLGWLIAMSSRKGLSYYHRRGLQYEIL